MLHFIQQLAIIAGIKRIMLYSVQDYKGNGFQPQKTG